MVNRIIPDTSIIVDGKLSELVKKEKLKDVEIVIPRAVLDELQAQASKGREPGFIGLEELKRLREICEKKSIKIRFTGERPSIDDIRLAKSGRMDALIRDVAKAENGTLYTADYVQALVGEAEGVKVQHIPAETKTEGLKFESYFTPDTLSLHLKEDVPPMVKRGKPGKFELVKLSEQPLTREELELIIREISEAARISKEGSFEIVRSGATVIQLKNYRIAIARPPFSDGIEITVIRPIVKLILDDYKLSEKLRKRLREKAEGIVIAGPPGSGKCLGGEQEIVTDQCVEKIGALFETLSENGYLIKGNPIAYIDNPPIRILSLNEKSRLSFVRPTRIYKRHTTKLAEIEFFSGRMIEVTPNHPLLTLNEKNLEWKEAEKLEMGDYILSALPINGSMKSIMKLDLVDLLDPERVYGVLKVDIGIDLPIYEKYQGKKYEILKTLYEKGELSGYKLCKLLNKDVWWAISELKNDGVIKRNLKGFVLVSSTWKLQKGESLPFKVLRNLKNRINLVNVIERIFYKPEYGPKSLPIKPVWSLSDELIELAAMILAEGLSLYSFGMSNNSKLLQNKFYNHMRKLFGIDKDRINLDSKNTTNDFEVKSPRILHELFEKIFELPYLQRKKSHNLKFPKILFKSPSDQLARFLRIYSDCEGCVSNSIETTTASYDMANGLIKAFGSLGVFAQLEKIYRAASNTKEKTKRLYYLVRISGESNLIKFNQYVGFNIKEKSLKLNSLLEKCDRGTDDELFPVKMLDNFRIKNLWKYKSHKSRISKELLEKLVKEFKINSEILNLLTQPHIKIEKIKDIKLIDKKVEVYDFETPNHNFLLANGILVHNSTFAGSLAEFYNKEKKSIIKTLESPRDLQVPPEVTQYAPLEGDFEKTADILLLVRPDYCIFDEVRKTKDFEVFSDMRLSGIGMVGVVHASNPIDAIQRFMGRIELGMIPHVVDTVVFVKDGEVKKVYDLDLTVKVPTGMMEADLARPVVDVKDFETGKLEYEIYTFGEENVIIPVTDVGKFSGMKKLAAERILQEIRKFDPYANVEVASDNQAIVRVDNEIIPRLIGKDGATIKNIEEKLGIHIEVEPRIPATGREIAFGISERGNSVELDFDKNYIGKIASVYVEDEFLFSATIGKKAQIKVTKSSDVGRGLVKTMFAKKEIKVLV